MNSRTRFIALAVIVLAMLAAGRWLSTGGGSKNAAAPARTAPVNSGTPGTDSSRSAKSAVSALPLADEQRAEKLSEATFMSANEVEPLTVERLSALLPLRLAGRERTGIEGARDDQTGVPITTVSARYAGKDGRELELRLSDLAGPKGVAAYAGWALVREQSNAGDDGYESTYTSGARRYYEQWVGTESRGERAVLLDGRYAVSVSGPVARAEELGRALDSVDLAAVEKLN